MIARYRIALVTHELTGGVGTMTRFLHGVLSNSSRYDSDVILLATSATDSASVLARHPRTWPRGPQILRETNWALDYVRVGAWFSEIEFQRYRPHRALTQLLNSYDIIQFVGGTAPWVVTGRHVQKKKCLWVATTNSGDRASRARDGTMVRRAWSTVMRFIAERFEQQGLNAADSVLALSPYTLESIRPKLGGKKAALAFCGVDTDVFRPLGEEDVRGRNAGCILCVARLTDARKNIAMLLRAYAAVSRRVAAMPDLCLVGEPLSEALIQLAADLGISERVRMPGPQLEADLAQLYRESLFFVLSSDEEGLGIVLLEAMASGLAVLSTASGGPSVVVANGESGFLTQVGDEEAFTEAMLRLVESPALRERFGAVGRRIVEDRFSVESTSRPLLAQYDRLLARCHDPR